MKIIYAKKIPIHSDTEYNTINRESKIENSSYDETTYKDYNSVSFFFLRMFQNYPEYVQKVTYLAYDHEQTDPILC